MDMSAAFTPNTSSRSADISREPISLRSGSSSSLVDYRAAGKRAPAADEAPGRRSADSMPRGRLADITMYAPSAPADVGA